MARKGCGQVDTIDSLIYTRRRQEYCGAEPPCKQMCTDRCQHKRERFIDRALNPESPAAEADLVIIDEVSMLGRQMGEELLSFGTPTLMIGDNAQLPPIGDAGYFTDRVPDFQLTEIHRQALESPVVRLATKARLCKTLQYGTYGRSAVVPDIGDPSLIDFDQIICGTHRRRRGINRRCRRRLGYRGDIPEPGEKLVCLKNDRRRDLRNGELWWVVEAKPDGRGFVDIVIRATKATVRSRPRHRRMASAALGTAPICRVSRSILDMRSPATKRREASGPTYWSSTKVRSFEGSRAIGSIP